jgi:hypothetical protein
MRHDGDPMAFVAAYQERLAELACIRVPCLVVGFRLDADTFVARARRSPRRFPIADTSSWRTLVI